MRYLLDVNALLALAINEHVFHRGVRDWLRLKRRAARFPVATCAVVELGFIRIMCQPVYGYTISEAKTLLGEIKTIRDLDFVFFPDDLSVTSLPPWVAKASQVTDGHLSALAVRHGAKLATLDSAIPGAFVIPR